MGEFSFAQFFSQAAAEVLRDLPSVQLLQKLSIRGTNGPDKLLKVIRNDILSHLGTECVRLTLSQQGNEHRLCDYIPTLPAGKNIVLFIGAMAKG